MEIAEILHLSTVIPVVTVHDARFALPLARALIAGGVKVIEVTLRSPAAFDAIRVISESLPNIVVGAGTLIAPEQFDKAKAAGARFVISPGLTPALLSAAKKTGLPYLPGVMTVCEIMGAREMGLTALKFFPAEVAGGVGMLKHLAPIFPEMHFCPTGGINRVNMKDYLALENVIAVAGTWITPKNLIDAKNWDAITLLAREAIKDV